MRSRRIDLDSELRKALEAGKIKIVYQPIVRLEDKSIAGFEALMRWEHPLHGRIPPSEFIAAAEESGLIMQLGLFVLEHAARELAYWQEALSTAPLPFVIVNVSSRQLLRHDLINDVKAVLARTGRRAGVAEARDHRKPGDAESGVCGEGADPFARARRRAVA